MTNYNTFSKDIYTTKRSILHFSSKLSKGMHKPNKKFLMDMCFGLAKSNSVLLSDFARSLEEPIETIQTVKLLSSRLEEFHEEALLTENYHKIIQSQFRKKDHLVIVDHSEIVKPFSNKLEALGQVKDGSTGKIEKGYWTTNMIGVTENKKHPIPIYSHLYSSTEDGFVSSNEETYKGLGHVRHMLGESRATFIMDREYDNVQMMKRILKQNDNFVIRLKKNRNLLYKNKSFNVRELALRRKGKIKFRTEIKGTIYDLKVSHINVEIPSLKNKKMTMVVVYGYGKDPMMLLTNKQVKQKKEVLSILKAYIMRWRIEEMFRVKKSEFGLESIRVRTLKRMNRFLFFVSAIIAFMSMKIEKQNIFFMSIIHHARGIKAVNKIKMYLYRFSAGMKAILSRDTKGIHHFKYIEKRNSKQLVLRL